MNNDLIKDRIQSRIVVDPLTGCWNWQGDWNQGLYPRIYYEGQYYKVHRLTYIIFNGQPKKWVLHKCNNKRCCNPNHLYDGTPSDNVKDMIKAGTYHHYTKTTCPKGHQYDKANKKGARLCSICISISARKSNYKHRQKRRAAWSAWYRRTGRPNRKSRAKPR